LYAGAPVIAVALLYGIRAGTIAGVSRYARSQGSRLARSSIRGWRTSARTARCAQGA